MRIRQIKAKSAAEIEAPERAEEAPAFIDN
jgi:hypothetical protein